MAADPIDRIIRTIALEIAAQPRQVRSAINMLDEGATVPFVARYRKEQTGGLDDTQLRTLEERLGYLRDLEARRQTVLDSIESQGKLDEDLKQRLILVETKTELEDLYLPFKPKRRTRAEFARERGLGALVEGLLADRKQEPSEAAKAFLSQQVADTKAALEGARDILTETFAENAQLLGRLRHYLKDRAVLRSRVIEGKQQDGVKFSDYFEHHERWATTPSHRALAMLRGRNEGILDLSIEVDAEETVQPKPVESMIARAYDVIDGQGPTNTWLMSAVKWSWKLRLSFNLSVDLMTELRQRSEEEAIRVFARNLKDLLLAAPAGPQTTMGLDPGIRTGIKVAIVDDTGKLLETSTVFPFQPRNDTRGATQELIRLVHKHRVELIAIGNGTASRETDKLVAEVIGLMSGKKAMKVVVSEAGASVYSASATAAAEFPSLDVSLRGAVSIARRLQDPLAELVKIEPKSIGVGQYQHDVDQYRLARALDAVVEDAVNAVGVDVNTASAPLLARVSGVGASLADAIIAHRDRLGRFTRRQELLEVSRLGPKTFEQCAGFLRISGGSEPLDASSVHPEAYGLAARIVAACGRDVRSLMGDRQALMAIDPRAFVDDKFGLPTVRDIIAELEKPARDPRPEFKTAHFADGIAEIRDLRPGMVLEGTVTNVAAFGAFVDIGVHQDGLVHVSQLADRFVKDPHQVVRAGDVVKVRVVEVDEKRKRIALSMKKDDPSQGAAAAGEIRAVVPPTQVRKGLPRSQPKMRSVPQGSLGDALAHALLHKK